MNAGNFNFLLARRLWILKPNSVQVLHLTNIDIISLNLSWAGRNNLFQNNEYNSKCNISKLLFTDGSKKGGQ